MFFALGVLVLAAGLWARVTIGRAATASAVDQHYWSLAAKAYREQRGLPVRIPNKYLMEDETQGYPPLFGILLGRLCSRALVRWMTPAVEMAELLFLSAFLYLLNVPLEMLVLAVGSYIAAPLLVVYNAQLTPRILGDFLLFSSMALQVVADLPGVVDWLSWLCWFFSALTLAAMLATHKMTVQLHLVLLPFWWWALGAWQVPMATLLGFAVFCAFVGWRFAIYQVRAHWDIVRFWHRHWRNLGGHQFNLSPIYGNPNGDRSSCFHQPGWRGIVKHARVLVSYAPLSLFLPICSLVSDTWPPDWVLVWFCGIYIWALSTLFIPALKCLGGGHLYVFNAIAPGAIYIAHLPTSAEVFLLLVSGCALTLVSLAMAWRVVSSRPTARSRDFDDAVVHLRKMLKSRIAVFPLQSAEAVAAATEHAVLWGGHGYGFKRLEGFFPVLTRPLCEFFREYEIDWVLWDSTYWPDGTEKLTAETLVQASSIQSFGRWRLAKVCLAGNC